MRKLLRSIWKVITAPARFVVRIIRNIILALNRFTHNIASFFKDEEVDDAPIGESLANTIEKITLPNNLIARVIPRSSLARLGILVTFDADLLPPNYSGKPILTIKNLSKKPILLCCNIAICQVVFEEVDKPVTGYRSKYSHSKLEPSKLEEEMKN